LTPFIDDRALPARIHFLINRAPISPVEAPAHSLPSPQPPLPARLHSFASFLLIDAHLFPPFALDRPPISALIACFCISALISCPLFSALIPRP
jgi:hypothetical protein